MAFFLAFVCIRLYSVEVKYSNLWNISFLSLVFYLFVGWFRFCQFCQFCPSVNYYIILSKVNCVSSEFESAKTYATIAHFIYYVYALCSVSPNITSSKIRSIITTVCSQSLSVGAETTRFWEQKTKNQLLLVYCVVRVLHRKTKYIFSYNRSNRFHIRTQWRMVF